jgi:hypothetical protein
MLEFSLTEPIQINTDTFTVGKTERIETYISSHGTIKLQTAKPMNKK